MARIYDTDKLYDEPDMLYNGMYINETWNDKYSVKGTSYTNSHTAKGTSYTDKYDEQEFYGG